MHLMYYLDEKGQRIYTLKVRVFHHYRICSSYIQALCTRCIHTPDKIIANAVAERNAGRQAHRIRASCALLSRRQVFETPAHLQEALRLAANAKATARVVAEVVL